MSKIIYDVIQRFEVENGVPRLVSTNIRVIQGGEDLLSLAISLLTQIGFYEKFEEKRASQYVGYRLKNPGKGAKRYQLVLAQRKEGLYISIPQSIFELYLLILHWEPYFSIEEWKTGREIDSFQSGIYWVMPSKENQIFEKLSINKNNLGILSSVGIYSFKDMEFQEIKHFFNLMKLESMCLEVNPDPLFPYMWQVSINSSDILEEFLGLFARIIMEQQ